MNEQMKRHSIFSGKNERKKDHPWHQPHHQAQGQGYFVVGG